MKTLLLEKNDISRMIAILNNGGIVAFPTDTVYGLAVRYDSFIAINKMKKAKQRPETKPFPMMVSKLKHIEMVADLTAREYTLIEKWMPGAITLILNKKEEIDSVITNGYPTIGVRMPDDGFVIELINLMGVPLLVPSANISGESVCTTHQQVLAQLDGLIDAVVMGESGSGLSSTIVDCTKEELILVRQGPIQLDEVKKSLEV